jgi:hypothetical protein
MFHCLGKLANLKISSDKDNESYVHSLVLYILYKEFDAISIQTSETKSNEVPTRLVGLIVSILTILINDIRHNDQTKTYIGSMFKIFVKPWMHSTNHLVQSKAVMFYAKWLPVLNPNASVEAIKQLIIGLKHSKLIYTDNFDEKIHEENFQKLSHV